MCQAYTGSGDMIGNNHGSSTHKATVRGQHLPVAQTPSHIPISISHSIIANFCKAIYAFFFSLFSKRRLNAQYSSTINRNALLFVAQDCSDICM